MENKFGKIKAVLFDLDGTLYLDGVIIGNADKTLDILRKKGVKIVFLTNNSSCTDDEYGKKLARLNLYKQGDFICSSLTVAAEVMKEDKKVGKIYPLATGEVTRYLLKKGYNIANKGEEYTADTVLLTFDKELSYDKIVIANRLIAGGARYIATHPDKVCPAKYCSIPDAGSFIALFKESNGRDPDIIIGKPYPYMAEYVAQKLSTDNEYMLMVGDRLYTDMAFGINAGLKTALVLSGETTFNDYEKSGIKVDAVIKSVDELAEYF